MPDQRREPARPSRPRPAWSPTSMRPAAWACGVDCALYAGYTIPPYYDSLVGKLIVHGRDRDECMVRLSRSLGRDGGGRHRHHHPAVPGAASRSPTSSPATTTSTGWRSWMKAQEEARRRDAGRLTPDDSAPATAAASSRWPSARDDPSLPDRSAAAGRHAAGRLPPAASGWRARCARTPSRSAPTPPSPRWCGLRRAAARPSRDLDQPADPGPLRRAAERGLAHSVECWQDGELVGGLYGVSLGAAFFGESMFSRERDASKVALVHLVARLIAGGFRLLDAQFMTEHLRSSARSRSRARSSG